MIKNDIDTLIAKAVDEDWDVPTLIGKLNDLSASLSGKIELDNDELDAIIDLVVGFSLNDDLGFLSTEVGEQDKLTIYLNDGGVMIPSILTRGDDF